MKKSIKLFSMLLACLAMLLMSSCLGDDDNDSKEKEWQEWLEDLQKEVVSSYGNYSGYVYFQPDVTVEKLDSVAATWSVVNDSTIDLRGVPASLLVDKMPEQLSSLKEAIAAKGTVNIEVQTIYNLYYMSPVYFYVYPKPVNLLVTIDGEERSVVINFKTSGTESSSYGQYLMSNGRSLIKLYPESVVVNKNTVAQFNSASCAFLYWLGQKL